MRPGLGTRCQCARLGSRRLRVSDTQRTTCVAGSPFVGRAAAAAAHARRRRGSLRVRRDRLGTGAHAHWGQVVVYSWLSIGRRCTTYSVQRADRRGDRWGGRVWLPSGPWALGPTLYARTRSARRSELSDAGYRSLSIGVRCLNARRGVLETSCCACELCRSHRPIARLWPLPLPPPPPSPTWTAGARPSGLGAMRMHPVPMVKSPLRFASHIPEPK